MIEQAKRTGGSRQLALKLYTRWTRRRQQRPDLIIPQGEAQLKELGLKNFVNQLAEPRRKQLEELKQVATELSIADKVALLVMTELPVLETSTLLQKLSTQLMKDENAPYFSKVNQNENCGSGCG